MAGAKKERRMRRKAAVCAGGILLLLCFALPSMCAGDGGAKKKDGTSEEPPHTEYLAHVCIADVTGKEIVVFDGAYRTLSLEGAEVCADAEIVRQVADLTVEDGRVLRLDVLNEERLSGKVLGVDREGGVELEGYGLIPFAEDLKVYRLGGEITLGSAEAIRIGYDFADFVLQDGKICAVLLAGDENMEYIRVLIKTSDYAQPYHRTAAFSCDTPYTVRYEREKAVRIERHEAGEEVGFSADGACFADGTERVCIVPDELTGRVKITDLQRRQGVPAYRGVMEIFPVPEGLVVINEVLLEEYLYAVVPSEMPADYPFEALKAQAVCARTYAYRTLLHPGYPQYGAHVDDSTGYQVYNDLAENENTSRAVRETAGQLLYVGEELAETYYYSTSCGFGSDEHVWMSELTPELSYLTAQSVSEAQMRGDEMPYTAEGLRDETVFRAFLKDPPGTDFERGEPWYRWTYEVKELKPEKLLAALKERYRANAALVLTLGKSGGYESVPIGKLGRILSIRVEARGEGGVASELVIEGTKNTYKVLSELYIRYVLCDGSARARRQDGSEVELRTLLPSGFFVIETVQEGGNVVGYKLSGGGFGHGAGMSQNGAKNMALAGYDASQILHFFYRGSLVVRGMGYDPENLYRFP